MYRTRYWVVVVVVVVIVVVAKTLENLRFLTPETQKH